MDICQCCLQRPPKIHLKVCDVQFGKPETYADLLKECYGLDVQSNDRAEGICVVCIQRLRDAYEFKLQVLMCQNSLETNLKLLDIEDESDVVRIKHEPKSDVDALEIDYDIPSDDHIVSSSYVDETFIPRKKIKNELKVVRKLPKRKSTTSSKSGHKKVLPKTKSKSKMAIEKPVSDEAKEILFMIENKLNKKKHMGRPILNVSDKMIKDKTEANMINIIKNTNCTPFFSKDLSGYLCYYCRKSLKDLPELRVHTNSVHGTETFQVHKDSSMLNIKVDITDLKCTLCDAPSHNIASVMQHLIESHGVNIHKDIPNYIQDFRLPSDGVFQCTSCHSKFETFKMLLQHMNRHYRNFVCEICDSGFLNKSRLKSHMFIHSTQSFKCPHCDKIFPTISKRNYHLKCHTGNKRKWVCPHCGLELSSDHLARNRHLMQEHNIAAATYKCLICNKNFLIKSRLTRHTKKYHLLEKSHVCSECDYSCFTKDSLRMHMLKHSGERKYKCDVCLKSYGRKYTLREHMRIHNNDRRHKCMICGNAFVQKCSLKSHMQSHHSMSLEQNELLNE